MWQNAHKNPMAALEYEGVGVDGQPIPAPQFITAEAPIRAVTEAMVGAEQGMKAVLGMYDANIGNRQGGESGIAIQRLQAQGDTGNYHLQDNLGRAIRYEIRVILGWLSTYYDTERVIRIIGEDGTQSQVKINGPITDESHALRKDQIGKAFSLTTGRYDVTVSVGPSYQSKREEDRSTLLGMLNGPMGELVAQRAGDLVAKTLDSPIAKELAKRLVPPDIAARDREGQGQEIPPQIQQQMQQEAQMNQALTQRVNELTDALEDKRAEIQAKNDTELAKAQIDAQTRLTINANDNQTKIMIAEAQILGAGVVPQLQAKIQELESAHEELAELALAHHAALVPQPEPGEAPEPVQTPQAMPSAGPMAGAPAGPAQPVSAGPMAGME